MAEKGFVPVTLTEELIDRYMESMASAGHKEQTIRGYRKSMSDLYGFLSEDKKITAEALKDWKDRLKELGYSEGTVNMRMTAVSGFLKYRGVKKASPSYRRYGPEMDLTEYLRFISKARKRGREQEYLLVRVFASMDIGVQQLICLTVEGCREGEFELSGGRRVEVTEVLGEELLEYAGREGILSGPVFVSRNGNPLDRSSVSHAIRELAIRTGMPPEKCCPQALRRMCRTAREEEISGGSPEELKHLDREELIEIICEQRRELELCRGS